LVGDQIENTTSKLQAVEYLNSMRRGFRLCNSSTSALLSSGPEYLARANLFSHYDAEGRHPGYR
jgi:hypothetical protein